MKRYPFFGLAAAVLAVSPWLQAQDAAPITPRVVVEEEVYRFVAPNNGSGPMWSFGCTPILRLGEQVIVSKMDTGPEVPPLANTRWVLLKRTTEGWKEMAEEGMYRQREPGVLAMVSPTDLYLNVNDSLEPVGAMYKPARPYLIHFALGKREEAGLPLFPQWGATIPHFTDHSYRGFAADPERLELLMLNIDAETGVEYACLLNTAGETLANGHIEFPIRACYPQVALKNRAAHVLAIGDIHEPVKEWETYKFEQTKATWDYVFRILYYTQTRDLTQQDFAPPIEIANVDATAGHISNKDLWVSPEGDAYILYTQREVASELMRDKFFPGKSVLDSLRLAVVHNGQVAERRTLLEEDPARPTGDARFHVTADGRVWAFLHLGGEGGGHKLMQVYPASPTPSPDFVDVPLQHLGASFLISHTRAGAPPSNVLDVFGPGPDNAMYYAEVRLAAGG
ncbi:MAG: hypothetical protein HYV26_02840 [Candidatus Hydrogenedentes bacterium]|nr:hypothetical protein [Candidatus Hydrogenedentota bacterium]